MKLKHIGKKYVRGYRDGFTAASSAAEQLVNERDERIVRMSKLIGKMAEALGVSRSGCLADCGRVFGCDYREHGCPIEDEMLALGVKED